MRAFTVFEMLVVLVVVSILATLALSRFNQAQERAHIATMQSDLRNFATARALYMSESDVLPGSAAGVSGYSFSAMVFEAGYQEESATDWALSVGHAKSGALCTLSTLMGDAGSHHIECSNGSGAPFTATTNGTEVELDASFAVTQASFAPVREMWSAALAASSNPVEALIWDMGDGAVLQGPPSTHTRIKYRYALTGMYSVRLRLVRADGSEVVGTRHIQMGNENPSVSFIWSPTEATANMPTTFDASASQDPDGTIAEYIWSIGGVTYKGVKVSHLFNSEGSYPVILTVRDNGGATSQIAQTITVSPAAAGAYRAGSARIHGYFGCAIYGESDLYCWGKGHYGNPGVYDEKKPTRAVPDLAVKEIAVGGASNCAITTAGATYCWGEGNYGLLGWGTGSDSNVPVPITDDPGFVQIVHEGSGVCGLTAAGKAYCWGRFMGRTDMYGTVQDAYVPRAVDGGLTFRLLRGGGSMCGITTSDDVYCWGFANAGTFGNGEPDNKIYGKPQLVQGGGKWKDIATGGFHTCGLTLEGVPYCWGDPMGGNGGTATDPTLVWPTLVAGGHVFEEIFTGPNADNTCARKASGEIYCWGSSGRGEFGTGNSDEKFTEPTLVVGGWKFSHYTMFGWTACGEETGSSTLYCWGYNWYGQTGTGLSASEVLSPQPVIHP